MGARELKMGGGGGQSEASLRSLARTTTGYGFGTIIYFIFNFFLGGGYRDSEIQVQV